MQFYVLLIMNSLKTDEFIKQSLEHLLDSESVFFIKM